MARVARKRCLCTPGLAVHLIVVARCDRPSQSMFNMHMYHSCSYYSSVAPTATAKEIRTKLVRALHPDKNRPRQSCRLSMRSGQC